MIVSSHVLVPLLDFIIVLSLIMTPEWKIFHSFDMNKVLLYIFVDEFVIFKSKNAVVQLLYFNRQIYS